MKADDTAEKTTVLHNLTTCAATNLTVGTTQHPTVPGFAFWSLTHLSSVH